MVMVTQTKVKELPTIPSPATASPSSDDSNNTTNTTATSNELLTVTESCWKRIQYLATKKNEPLDTIYLRVFVDAGGCSGFSYKFELDSSETEEEDVIFKDPASSARLVVDEGSLDIIKGSMIDFVQEMIKSSFEVRDNPQSESACGCGSSFALKNFGANPAVD
jgi:iron-sulfur cluster assembly accessory protein